MTHTYSRYDDHARKARQLTEHTDKHGAPYFEKVQGMLRSHYQQTQPHILFRAVSVDAQKEAQSLEDNQEKGAMRNVSKALVISVLFTCATAVSILGDDEAKLTIIPFAVIGSILFSFNWE